ncbi:MAG: DMT family transporter [Pseudomonadota bacterium]
MKAAATLVPDNLRGALWILASVAGATAMTLAVRVLTPDLHSAMLAFLRSGLGLVLLVPLFWRARRQGEAIAFTAWPHHLVRGLLISLALNAGFYAIWQLPMAEATVLFFTAPVFAIAFAALFVGERVGPWRWTATAAGFCGAVVILRPGVGAFDPAALAALGSAFAFAASLIVGRVASARDGSEAVFVSTSVITAIATLPGALLVWRLPETAAVWAMVAVLVLSSALRTYADIRAYAVGEAGFLAPFSYLRLLTIGTIGYVWFDETLDAATLLGGAIIVGATLTISLREARLRRRGSGVRLP